jgi:hypothetical protein
VHVYVARTNSERAVDAIVNAAASVSDDRGFEAHQDLRLKVIAMLLIVFAMCITTYCSYAV